MTQQYVSTMIKTVAEKASIRALPLRCARAGLATEMFRAGYNVYDIQGQLGHSNIGTTTRYMRPTMEERASAFKGF